MQKINWNEWNKETFQKAAKENKPILLDIHGVWCHWCHVMEQTSYSDPEVIEIVNKDFIPIKVDTDKGPAINKRYNQGGWPSTVFLTPTGQIITGTTYIPPDSLKDMMFRVIDTFKDIKFQEVVSEGKKLIIDNNIKLDNKIIEKIMEDMLNNFDFDYGGFGVPKFPMTDAINLVFDQYLKIKNNNSLNKNKSINEKDLLIIARLTLDNMKGIFDNIEGGFYRYSVTQQWNEPHYEKMMETNAGIIQNYLQGYEIMKKDEYKDIAIKSLNYIKNNLSNKDGAFYGSQDADEEYYPKNLEERKKHGKPFIDKNIYTDLSSMMISTYIYAYKILKDDFYKNFAVKSIKFLIDKSYDEKFGMFHFYDSKRKFLPGMLLDNVYFIKALIDVFEITKDKLYINTAVKLNKFVINNFMDKDKCFFDKVSNPEDIGFLKFRDKLLIENSIVAINLIKLSKINNNKEYLKIAENILKAFYSEYEKYSVHGAIYGLAVEMFLELKANK
ncbi:MAG: thioredoxin domain-containing protein [Nanoarchaeota archaeon]|nr:thioredoxin domain-containing protein [Nanoarchaeota archaeon]